MNFHRPPMLRFSHTVRPSNRPMLASALRGHVRQRCPWWLKMLAILAIPALAAMVAWEKFAR